MAAIRSFSGRLRSFQAPLAEWMAEGVGCARSLRSLRLPSVAEPLPHAFPVRKVLILQLGLPCTLHVHGGGSRIRTHVPDLREAVFKTAALSHSAIPPVFPPKNNVTVFVLRVRYESLLLFYAVNPI